MHAAERQRLTRTMSGEPMCAVGTAMKCAAGLAFLILLAAIGARADGNGSAVPEAPGAGRATASAAKGSASAAHRKLVFEERRARLEHTAPLSVLASPASDTTPAHAAP
jgi:hypothetical protein